ncbi:class I SAM-dependent methyltransferase [Chryseolinea sp. H1M3-3]|uniref:class I SAM-dependent methyltransferase n=1 Tax=Chryseolinea sp. H1M3-3 TaxID=3034144 RepID=UPI0023ED7A1E|nr:class I SAM-dependent methyltransferase [Chryseolinea sp. H1M3-3]
MNEKFEFGVEYYEYFRKAVDKSLDGTVIPGLNVCNHYVNLLGVNPNDRLLDLGCSYGRLYPVFANYTKQIFGADVDLQVVNEAIKNPYVIAIVGQAEKLAFPSNFFNHVVAWGVFDIVDQIECLKETNRILKTGGKFLFTAKGAHYPDSDCLAYVAERNAKLKNFPNRFIDLELLMQALPLLGFTIERKFHFSKRGDLGLNQPLNDLKEIQSNSFYEFVAILKKVTEPSGASVTQWWDEYSVTARAKAECEGFGTDVLGYFRKSFDADNPGTSKK